MELNIQLLLMLFVNIQMQATCVSVQVCASLLHSSLHSQWFLQRMWLSTRDLPLQVECRKLAPQLMGQFEVEWMINLKTVRLRLPASLRFHYTFHFFRVQPVLESDLSPRSRSWMVHLHTPSEGSSTSAGGVGTTSKWWTGKDTA